MRTSHYSGCAITCLWLQMLPILESHLAQDQGSSSSSLWQRGEEAVEWVTCSLLPAQTCIKNNTTIFYFFTLRFVCWFGISVPVWGMWLFWFAWLHPLLAAVFEWGSLLYHSLLLLSLHRHGCSHSSRHRSVLFLPVSKKADSHTKIFIVLTVSYKVSMTSAIC